MSKTSEQSGSIITLKTLAKQTGVSTAAVSNALNGKGRMSQATRERICQLAQELGYRPNPLAASLRTGLSKNIGFVMTPDSDPESEKRWAAYSSHILYSLVLEAGKNGYAVSIISADHPEILAYSHCDVLFYFDPFDGEILIDEAQRLNIPILSNDIFGDPRISLVVDSGFGAMTRAALDVLWDSGSKRPGLLTEIPGIPSDEIAEQVYRAWCEEHNVTPCVAQGDYGRTNVTECVLSLLEQGCDGIYSFYEEAEIVLNILRSQGLRVPEDILFIAATTSSEETAALGVTSTVFHSDSAPRLSFEHMIGISRNPDLAPVTVELPWELIHDRSTER